MTEESRTEDKELTGIKLHVVATGIFTLLGCVGLAGYFIADGTPASNLISAAVYIAFVQIAGSAAGAGVYVWGANIPLLIALAHYFGELPSL